MGLTVDDMQSLWIVIAIAFGLSFVGYYILRIRNVLSGWILFFLTTFLAERISFGVHPVIRMLDIILVMFLGMKIITTIEAQKQREFQLTLFQWLVFCFGWAGMRADIFQTLGQKPQSGKEDMIWFGISRLIQGLFFVFLARWIYTLAWDQEIQIVLITILLLIGFSLILHFGLLSISAGVLKFFGVKTYYLFNSPAKSSGLDVFWGRRWNKAFSEMTSVAVYRPLKGMIGNNAALILSFLFSGLLHEMAISLPVNQGFGLPLLYFAIQGMAIWLELNFPKWGITLFNDGVAKRIWMWFWIIVPMPILFHVYFIEGIIWPLAGLFFPL